MKKILSARSARQFVKTHWAFLTLLALMVGMRLWFFPEHVHFANDEARDAFRVQEIVNGQLRLTGPEMSVGGFYLGPLFYYLLVPVFVLFGGHPAYGALFIAGTSMLTVIAVYAFADKHFSKELGLMAAAILGFSSYFLLHSWSWNPHVVPIISIAVLWLLFELFFKKEKSAKKHLLILGIVLGVGLHFHGQVLWIIMLSLTFLAVFTTHSKKEILIRIIGGVVIMQFPTILHEILSGGTGIVGIADWLAANNQKVSFSERIIGGFSSFIELSGKVFWPFSGEAARLEAIFLTPLLFILIRKPLIFSFGPRTKKGVLIVLLTSFIGIYALSFFVITGEKYFHFLTVLFPIIALLLGLLYAELLHMERVFKWVAALFILGILMANGVHWRERSQKYESSIPQEHFDIPLRDIESATSSLLACEGTVNLAVSDSLNGYQKAFIYSAERKGVKIAEEAECSFSILKAEEGAGEQHGRLAVYQR